MNGWTRRGGWATLILSLSLILSLCAACGPGMPGGAAVGPKVRVENVWSRPASALVTMTSMDTTPAMTGTASMTDTAGGGTTPTDHPPRGNGAVYFTVVNEGGAPDRIMRAQTDVAESVELHVSRLDNGVMKMEPVAGGVEVAAGGKVELKPGSYHVMLMGLKQDLKPGDRFPVTVELEKSGALKVEAIVRPQ
jgi:copper(I)-binding protein